MKANRIFILFVLIISQNCIAICSNVILDRDTFVRKMGNVKKGAILMRVIRDSSTYHYEEFSLVEEKEGTFRLYPRQCFRIYDLNDSLGFRRISEGWILVDSSLYSDSIKIEIIGLEYIDILVDGIIVQMKKDGWLMKKNFHDFNIVISSPQYFRTIGLNIAHVNSITLWGNMLMDNCEGRYITDIIMKKTKLIIVSQNGKRYRLKYLNE